MIAPFVTDSRVGKGTAIVLTVAVHVCLLIAFMNLRGVAIQLTAPREIEIILHPLRQPQLIQPVSHRSRPVKPRARPLPQAVTLEGLRDAIRQLSKLPPVPFSLSGLPDALTCDGQSARLPPGERNPCGHSGWHYDATDMRNVLLNEPPPEHIWTAAEVNLYIERTTDPCHADRSAGLPFCVDRIIYGPATIPDSKTPPSGLSLGASLLGGH